MSRLFSPLVIKNIHLKNRIIVSPMCQYSAKDGFTNDWHMVHLGSRAVGGVRSIWPDDNPLFVRISATDWMDGGWDIEEAVKLASLLKTRNVDLMDCSSGGMSPLVPVPTEPGYQVRFSEAIRKTGIFTGAVGLITTAGQAESILQDERADVIFLAREMLRNPYFPLLAAKELGDDINWPVQYLRAKP